MLGGFFFRSFSSLFRRYPQSVTHKHIDSGSICSNMNKYHFCHQFFWQVLVFYLTLTHFLFLFLPLYLCVAQHCTASPLGAAGGRTANSAVFAELTRSTGGNLHLFSGSLLLEDNLIRFNSVGIALIMAMFFLVFPHALYSTVIFCVVVTRCMMHFQLIWYFLLLKQELLESIQSIAASEVKMKLQCSNGLRATEYFGAGSFVPDMSEVLVGGLDRQSSSCFVLNFDPESILGMVFLFLFLSLSPSSLCFSSTLLIFCVKIYAILH